MNSFIINKLMPTNLNRTYQHNHRIRKTWIYSSLIRALTHSKWRNNSVDYRLWMRTSPIVMKKSTWTMKVISIWNLMKFNKINQPKLYTLKMLGIFSKQMQVYLQLLHQVRKLRLTVIDWHLEPIQTIASSTLPLKTLT